MLKRDFFIAALQHNAHYQRKWLLRLFNIAKSGTGDPVNYQIDYQPDSVRVWVDGEWVILLDAIANQPLFEPKEPLDLEPGELLNVDRPIKTSYGEAVFNAYVLIPAFGKHYPYVIGDGPDGRVSIPKIEKWIVENVLDDPIDGVFDPEKVYIRDYITYANNMDDLGTLTHYIVVASSKRSMTTDPRFAELRKELLETYKDRLHDPATQAVIQNALIELDKAWIAADEEGVSDFYLKEKAFNTARKRMFLIHGPESGFEQGGDAELVINSLDEGWDIDKFPHMVNSVRAGSYYRGFLTAQGGESVKFFLRIFQNTMISEPDCGVDYGWRVLVTDDLIKPMDGMWQIVGKELKLLTEETIKAQLGQTIEVRSPIFCKTGHSDYCEKCMGVKNSQNPASPGSSTASMGSTFMLVMMSAAHAKELTTAPMRVDQFLQ